MRGWTRSLVRAAPSLGAVAAAPVSAAALDPVSLFNSVCVQGGGRMAKDALSPDRDLVLPMGAHFDDAKKAIRDIAGHDQDDDSRAAGAHRLDLTGEGARMAVIEAQGRTVLRAMPDPAARAVTISQRQVIKKTESAVPSRVFMERPTAG